jgi:hypothetical protein
MEGTEKPSGWNYDASCMLTSLLVLDLENFKCLILVAQSVPCKFSEDVKRYLNGICDLLCLQFLGDRMMFRNVSWRIY